MLKIVLTGGPCSGKTTMCKHLIKLLTSRGYEILTVPEAATMLITNGIKPHEELSMDEFQRFVIDTQLTNERLFVKKAMMKNHDKTVIFFDRGLLDGGAYTDMESVMLPCLKEHGETRSSVFDRYDAVFHLVTAANGAPEFYQWNDPTKEETGNNAARSESPALAIEKDQRTMDCWIGHPHLRVFDNSTDFEEKMNRVVKEVFALLGEPVPLEIERKFLINMPTEEQIKSLGYTSKETIVQTYLVSDNNKIERRVRQRGSEKNGFSFYYTEKEDKGNGIREEREDKISTSEYLRLLTESDVSMHQIVKTRYCFVYENQYFEMDIYPHIEEYAILEIEVSNIDDEIVFPPLDVLKDVTNDVRYKNRFLALTGGLAH